MKRFALAAALLIATAKPALAGPPWITIEIRPMGSTMIYARTFHHATPLGMALTGTAEGLVNGQRRSVPLRFEITPEGSVFAVNKTWSDEGVWVLNIGITEEMGAGAAVGIDRSGSAAFVRFPRTYQGASRMATRAEVEAMLRALDANQQPPALGGLGLMGILRVLGPLAVLAGLTILAASAAMRVVRWARRPQVVAA
jgi:hypothetical protein